MKNPLEIRGKVMRGDGYGKKIGFPTINLDRRNFLKIGQKPNFGIYKADAFFPKSGKKYKAAAVIGPLDGRGLPKIEAHLIGFKGDAYGKKAVLKIKKFIRKYKIFKDEKNLIAQIKKDIEKCLQA